MDKTQLLVEVRLAKAELDRLLSKLNEMRKSHDKAMGSLVQEFVALNGRLDMACEMAKQQAKEE